MTSNTERVKETIYAIENVFIQNKTFNEIDGRPIFISNLDIKNNSGCSDLDQDEISIAINELDPNEFIIFNNENGDVDINPDITFRIRSRTYHIIWTLYRSQNRARGRVEQNVSDFRYLRHIKHKPRTNHDLSEIFDDEKIRGIENFNGDFMRNVVLAIVNNSKYQRISRFQLNSTINILNALNANRDQNTTKKIPGLTIEAGTGFGKSFAYQLPLLLWIIFKKYERILKIQQGRIKESQEHVNCTALLIFPRNALADDQRDTLNQLIEIINAHIQHNSDSKIRAYVRIKKIIEDYGGRTNLLEVNYADSEDGRPDIILTHPKSLQRRLVNPECSPVYRNSIDCVLYDEVHLWDGIEGARISAINARLQNIMESSNYNKKTLFVGMSATIDKADIHCQKLFAQLSEKRPVSIIEDDESEMEINTIEHHLILKPRSGRPARGVGVDTSSCLIHNRRNGLGCWHDDQLRNARLNRADQQSRIDQQRKPKTLTFIDSLDGSGKFANKLNDFEYFFDGHSQRARNADSNRPHRSYLFHYQPARNVKAGERPCFNCEECVNRQSPQIFHCDHYSRGECWYFSQDDAGQYNQVPYDNWFTIAIPDRLSFPQDNIRSSEINSYRRLKETEDKYDYFTSKPMVTDAGRVWLPDGRQPNEVDFWSDIDNVIATSTLEVGVDFENIKEIIQFGEIRSPSSYRQKTGRGAREGNLDDGLFCMTVINESPLAYHHFKHFKRLIESSLDPLKLEPTNPYTLKSNAYFSILDFIALKGINLFRFKNKSSADIKAEYVRTMGLFEEWETKRKEAEEGSGQKLASELEQYLNKFYLKFNRSENYNDIQEVLEFTKDFLSSLETERTMTINGQSETKTVHEWFVKSITDDNIRTEVQTEFHGDVFQKRSDSFNVIEENVSELRKIFEEKFSNDASLIEKLSNLEVNADE